MNDPKDHVSDLHPDAAEAQAAGEVIPAEPVREPPSPIRETEDERFLESRIESLEQRASFVGGKDSWRVFRIMGEFVEGFDELSRLGPSVSIFGSARVTAADPMYWKCVETARLLGEAGFGIVTGGGPGMMEAANRGAKEAGVDSIGCNIELPFEQGQNRFVERGVDFRYFFVRKTMFVKYSSAFVCFPGGFGTLDELFESLTLIQTRKIRNFPVVLFGSDYWKGMVDWIRDTMAVERKISEKDLDLMLVTDSSQEVVDHIKNYHEANGEGARGGMK